MGKSTFLFTRNEFIKKMKTMFTRKNLLKQLKRIIPAALIMYNRSSSPFSLYVWGNMQK